jgi:hypothetical protein
MPARSFTCGEGWEKDEKEEEDEGRSWTTHYYAGRHD